MIVWLSLKFAKLSVIHPVVIVYSIFSFTYNRLLEYRLYLVHTRAYSCICYSHLLFGDFIPPCRFTVQQVHTKAIVTTNSSSNNIPTKTPKPVKL